MTTEEFIQKARLVHGKKYDYSKVEYINNRTKVCIICPKHGEFLQIPNNHLRGAECKKCGLERMKQSITSNTEEFIQKARSIHGNRYDYHKIEYNGAHVKICIVCPEHGEFWQKPNNHLNGHGCPKCDGPLSMNLNAKKQFVDKAKKIHGDKYDYSKTNYINSNTNIIILCRKHGEFLQNPTSHLRGSGCPKCNGWFKAKEQFVEKARKIHGNKYDYSKSEYTNTDTKVCIVCPEHGEFWQTPYIHLHGSGCPKCNGSESERLKAQKEFVLKSVLIHGNKYDYSKVEYKSNKIKVCIVCPEHGEFWQTPTSHLRGSGCPKCSESHGEREIRKWLDKHNIEYIREKTFKELRGIRGRMLRFDFYLPKHNICIEFDGKQHREFMKKLHRTKERFETIQEHDKRKNEFCSKNGIKLVRIWQENGDFKKLVVY